MGIVCVFGLIIGLVILWFLMEPAFRIQQNAAAAKDSVSEGASKKIQWQAGARKNDDILVIARGYINRRDFLKGKPTISQLQAKRNSDYAQSLSGQCKSRLLMNSEIQMYFRLVSKSANEAIFSINLSKSGFDDCDFRLVNPGNKFHFNSNLTVNCHAITDNGNVGEYYKADFYVREFKTDEHSTLKNDKVETYYQTSISLEPKFDDYIPVREVNSEGASEMEVEYIMRFRLDK